MIAKSRIFEVYESYEKRRQLYSINLVPGKKVYGERLISENGIEYREWDAKKSKLASSILKGSPNVGIRKNDVVLYLGSASGTTVSHVSDIVGDGGLIFAVDIAQRNQLDIFLKNGDLFLKSGGYALLAVKARSMDVTKNPRQIFREVKEILEKEMTIIDQRDLEPFQRDHAMFICKKK